MSGKVAQSIRRGLKEALAYAKKEARAADYRVHIPADIDVKAIREKLALTQARGRFIIMADADESYDLSDLQRFVDGMRAGDDLVFLTAGLLRILRKAV